MASPSSIFRVGCAGWSLGQPHAALFGAGDSQLERYATRFDAVEINSSFHRPHRPETYARWAGLVPDAFRFSVKAPRTLTHDARLRGGSAELVAFVEQIAGLGAKLGAVLVQLPPSLAYEPAVAGRFFALLRRLLAVPLACEPRHASWTLPAAEAMLLRHRVARVAADPPAFKGAETPSGEAGCTYWRWHGSPHRYYSEYGSAALDRLAALARQHTPAGGTAWLILDNTAHGHATTDALALRARLNIPSAPR